MKRTGFVLALVLVFPFCASLLRAQEPSHEAPVSLPASPTRNSAPVMALEGPATVQIAAASGFRQYVVGGKLQLSLENAIQLALANNTDIQLDRTPIYTSYDQIQRAHGAFDPAVNTNFNATRATQPTFSQLSGSPTLSQLTQNAQLGIADKLESGIQLQLSLNSSKTSTNSSFNFFNPSVFSTFRFSFSQPLLRGFGLFPNRAPIIIAQRNLNVARDVFEREVNDIIQSVVNDYWAVVEARENLAVRQKSLDQAQQSYDHDRHALELGALPPLDIYRSQSQVAQSRVVVIQAQYSLMRAEDQFRHVIGADIDPNVRALDLDLTEQPDPSGTLMSIDISTALQEAMKNRPEIESVRESLANDKTSIRLAHNNLMPSLSLTGSYTSSGLGGDEINTASTPPVIVSTGGFGDSLNQAFTFGYPTYQMGFSLTLPIRNRTAKANLGDALASRRYDLYSQRQLQQAITLDVTNSVHNLEEAKLSMAAAKISYNLAQKNLQAEQRKYDLGAEHIYFVLEAQTELAQAEQTLVNEEVTYRMAVTSVEHATGGLLNRYHIEITKLVSPNAESLSEGSSPQSQQP